MANEIGRATAITVLTPVRPGWAKLWLRPLFRLGEIFPKLLSTLQRLSFIHFARWTIVDRLPPDAPPADEDAPRYTYLYFESNFNGSWDHYIDAFSNVVPRDLTAVWFS